LPVSVPAEVGSLYLRMCDGRLRTFGAIEINIAAALFFVIVRRYWVLPYLVEIARQFMHHQRVQKVFRLLEVLEVRKASTFTS